MPTRATTLAAIAALAIATATGCGWMSDENPQARPPALAPPAPKVSAPWMPPSVTRFASLIATAAQRHHVDANLVAIVMLVESGGDPYAEGNHGEKGLMQLSPALAADIAARRGILGHNPLRLIEPSYNVDLAAWHLAELHREFRTNDPVHSVGRTAAAYAGGPALVARGGVLPSPTRKYMQWVSSMWRQRFQPRSSAYDAWYRSGGKLLVDRATTSVVPPLLPPGPLMIDGDDNARR